MKRSDRRIVVNALLVVGAVLTAFPLLWMVSVSFMPPRRGEHLSAAAAAAAADARQLPRAVRAITTPAATCSTAR